MYRSNHALRPHIAHSLHHNRLPHNRPRMFTFRNSGMSAVEAGEKDGETVDVVPITERATESLPDPGKPS